MSHTETRRALWMLRSYKLSEAAEHEMRIERLEGELAAEHEFLAERRREADHLRAAAEGLAWIDARPEG